MMNSVFDGKAASWDTDNRIRRAAVIADCVKATVPVLRNARILDFGAGTGLLGMNFLDVTDRITFVEKSAGMREVLSDKIARNGTGSLRVFEDMQSSELRNASFDLIVSSMVFHHIRDLKGIGRTMYNLLRDGGSLCIVDLMPEDGSFHGNEEGFDGYNGFDPEWLGDRMTECGFTHVDHRVFYNDIKRNGSIESAYSLFILRMDR